MSWKKPVRRCGNCVSFPGNGSYCSQNTWTGGEYKKVRAWDYGCGNFKYRGSWDG